MKKNRRRDTVIILSLPRCGTHFIWSRYVNAKRYQLIYDADRIPALVILSQLTNVPLTFLYPAPINPNYNFQYNSLLELDRILPAKGHLEFLQNKYATNGNRILFEKIMDLQAIESRYLFSINRFCYTTSYDFLDGITWTIEDAINALELFWDWQCAYNPKTRFVFICRNIKEWINSLALLWGKASDAWIKARLLELPRLFNWCNSHSVPIYLMEDVIPAFQEGYLELGSEIDGLDLPSQRAIEEAAIQYMGDIDVNRNVDKLIRWKRLFQYLQEKDPVLRTSLVRSIGKMPISFANRFPYFIGKLINNDYAGVSLNNAAIARLDTVDEE